MKVCIIGPVVPFRGGIARHTTALARELAGRPNVQVRVHSFGRLYPPFLYPGESQVQENASPPIDFEVVYRLDALNPFTWWRECREIQEWGADATVIPAWTAFVAPCLGFIAYILQRNGVKVLQVVHNAEDHERAWWKSLLTHLQIRQASQIVTHNHSIERKVRRRVPGVPVNVYPHPVYDEYPEPQGRLPRTAGLELLFFGLVRRYKGLDIGLRGLALSGLSDVRLSVVGEFWEGRRDVNWLIDDLSLGGMVELVPRYVSDEEAAEYFDRCDAVLVPYRSASGSGVVALAYRYSRPIIASDVPGLAESVIDGSTGWVFSAGDASDLGRLLEAEVSRSSAKAMRPAVDEAADKLTWKRFADAMLTAALEETV